MQPTRRAVLAAVPVALAGCGQSFRENPVPGGLQIRNRRRESVTVAVRAALLPDRGADDAAVTASPHETPSTPRDQSLEDPDATGGYTVAAEQNRAVSDFFPESGRWAFEAVVDAEDAEMDRTRIQLHAALPGPTGADTVVVRVTGRGVTARATTVDD